MACDAFITYATMFRPEWFSRLEFGSIRWSLALKMVYAPCIECRMSSRSIAPQLLAPPQSNILIQLWSEETGQEVTYRSQFSIVSRLGAESRIERYRSSEVVCTQPESDNKREVRHGMAFSLCSSMRYCFVI